MADNVADTIYYFKFFTMKDGARMGDVWAGLVVADAGAAIVGQTWYDPGGDTSSMYVNGVPVDGIYVIEGERPLDHDMSVAHGPAWQEGAVYVTAFFNIESQQYLTPYAPRGGTGLAEPFGMGGLGSERGLVYTTLARDAAGNPALAPEAFGYDMFG